MFADVRRVVDVLREKVGVVEDVVDVLEMVEGLEQVATRVEATA